MTDDHHAVGRKFDERIHGPVNQIAEYEHNELKMDGALSAKQEIIDSQKAEIAELSYRISGHTTRHRDIISDLKLQLEHQRRVIEKAGQYLREGKAKFAPHTTNSFVDDLIKEIEALGDGSKT